MAQPPILLDDDFKQWLEALLLEYHVPGMSIAVVNGDHMESAGYGMARLPDTPATPDTLWCMASTTKAFSAALLGLVIEKYNRDKSTMSQISFSTTVSDILPDEFVLEDPYLTANVTLEDLLSHRTGMPSYDMLFGPWMASSDLANTTQKLKYLGAPTHPFRTKMIYNNIMYGVVGRVVEKLTGKPYNTVLQEKILDPLKMENTYPGIETVSRVVKAGRLAVQQVARGYAWNEANDQTKDGKVRSTSEEAESAGHQSGYYTPQPYSSLKGCGPAGDLISSVNDYAKWVQALLKASSLPTKPEQSAKEGAFISSQLWTELSSPRTLMLPVQEYVEDFLKAPTNAQITPRTYALGWITEPYLYPGIAKLQHGGGLPGFGTGVMLVPDLNLGIVMSGNTMETPAKIWQALEKELIGKRTGVAKDQRRKRTEPTPKVGDLVPVEKGREDKIGTSTQTSLPVESSSTVKVRQLAAQKDKGQEFVLEVDGKDVHLGSRYLHPALGTFSLRILDSSATLQTENPSIGGIKMNRESPSKENETNNQQSARDFSGVLQATAVEARGLDLSFLLHFRGRPEDTTSQAFKILVFDLESIIRAGDLTKDALEPTGAANSGIVPPSHDQDDAAKYVVRNEVVWSRFRMKKRGGILVLKELDTDVYPGTFKYEVDKIGMSMGRDDMPDTVEDDVLLEQGWEKKINWFHRVDVGDGASTTGE